MLCQRGFGIQSPHIGRKVLGKPAIVYRGADMLHLASVLANDFPIPVLDFIDASLTVHLSYV
jgi:hypothetical protein